MNLHQKFSSREEHEYAKEPQERKGFEEALFQEMVREQLFEQFYESMEDAHIPDDQIDHFFEELATHDEEEIERALSLPYELQGRFFSKHVRALQSGKESMKDLVDLMIERARRGEYQVGYHISNAEILPKEEGDMQVWEIMGTEKDHRDQDLMRAYYSFDYEHLYRKKGGKFLYLIRAETGEDSSHKQDNDGTWGRASQLSVITVLDLRDVDTRIEKAIKDKEKEDKKEKAA
jgi:hypothetical protein